MAGQRWRILRTMVTGSIEDAPVPNVLDQRAIKRLVSLEGRAQEAQDWWFARGVGKSVLVISSKCAWSLGVDNAAFACYDIFVSSQLAKKGSSAVIVRCEVWDI